MLSSISFFMSVFVVPLISSFGAEETLRFRRDTIASNSCWEMFLEAPEL